MGSKHKCVKHKIDAVYKENFTYSYSIIKGETLDCFESISYHTKIEASPDGGFISKTTRSQKRESRLSRWSIDVPKRDNKAGKEEIKAGKEKAAAIYKARPLGKH